MKIHALLLALPFVASSLSAQGLGPNQSVPESVEVAVEEAGLVEPWSGSVQVGGSSSNGNTNTSSVSAFLDATKKDGRNRYEGRAAYNFTKDRQVNDATEDNRSLYLEYNRFVDTDLYLLANSGYAADEVEGLDARVFASLGAGYQFYAEKHLDWNAELSAALVDEDYAVDVADADYGAVRMGSSLSWKVNKKVRFEQDLELFLSLDETDDVILLNNSRVEVSLAASMVASISYLLDYDNTPASGAERADHRLAMTVGWTF